MKKSDLLTYTPLFAVAVFSFATKLYDPLRSPVLAALDPWGWTVQARQYLQTGRLSPFYTQTGYPPTFMYLVAGLAGLFNSDPYDIVRYLPVLSALNVIPIYLLALEVFHSRKVSALASVLAITSRFYFMRTSIGIPEGLAHFFLVFALLFLLKSISSPSWKYRLLGIASIALSALYYHFTVLILIPFVLILPIVFWSRKISVAKESTILTVPALLVAGLVWYLQVLPNMIHYYLSTTTATYAKPTFASNFRGLASILAYSVAKSSVVALSEMGYVITTLAFVGIAYLLMKRSKRQESIGVPFLAAYLCLLISLILFARIVYNLGVAGAGDSSVYLFSWLTIPASILGADIVFVGLSNFGVVLQTKFRFKDLSRFMKVVAICLIILVGWINLNSFNYYKAPAGGGPIPNSFYYYKPLTDQEYYALRYIREHTPVDSLVLVAGLEYTILTDQEVVAGRTIIAISNMTAVGQGIEISGEVAFSDGRTANLSLADIQNNTLSNQHIYVVTGIRNVSVDVARSNGEPPAVVVQNERIMLNQLASLGRTEQFYQNDQITVVQAFSVQIQY